MIYQKAPKYEDQIKIILSDWLDMATSLRDKGIRDLREKI